jgi:choline dehydrogenase
MRSASPATPARRVGEPDWIIVGGGTAGAILAARLSASGEHRVLLLEAGEAPYSPWIRIPAGFSKLLVDPVWNWRFWSEPEPGTGGRRISVPRGRGLGGSTLINGGIAVRGQPADYDQWAARGAQGWDWQTVAPYFRRFECWAGARSAARGEHGPMHVTPVRERHRLGQAFIAAAREAGHPENPDYNAGEQRGFGPYQVFQHRGRRWSVHDGYLGPALRRPNLQVLTGTLVTRLLIDAGRCTGVEYRIGDAAPVRVGARREVLLCAGAVQSPQLLELSGIGQPERLRALGIAPVHALPGVGEHYQDHYAVRMHWRVRSAVTVNQRARGPRLALELLRYAVSRRGLLTLGTGLVHGFVRSRHAVDDRPDVQYFFVDASYANAAERILDRFPGMTVGVTQLRPRTTGSIHIRSADPHEPPAIRPCFLSAPGDAEVLVDGVRIAREIMAQPAISRHVVAESAPGPVCADNDALIDWVRQTGQTIYHPTGTCRMGIDADAVVDPALRVRGLDGLRVVDASVMPSIVSGNTQAAVMMIAERAADLIGGGTTPFPRTGHTQQDTGPPAVTP